MKRHVMIDLETLGTEADAVIASIGAVVFTPDNDAEHGFTFSETFYANVNVDNQIKLGRSITASTLWWWMKQEERARRAVIVPDSPVLKETLGQLRKWSDKHGLFGEQWWAHATFDFPIIAHACKQTSKPTPYAYRMCRDIRTLNQLAGDVKLSMERKTHHHALDDALFQCHYVSKMLLKLEDR